jgi:excisionase family DNA binding protein
VSSLWNSLLAQADAEDRAALASTVAEELRQLVEETASTSPSTMPLLSPADVAARCGVHVETVRRAIRSGQLPALKVGSRFRIDPADINRWGVAQESTQQLPSATPHRRRPRPAKGVMARAVSDLQSVSP